MGTPCAHTIATLEAFALLFVNRILFVLARAPPTAAIGECKSVGGRTYGAIHTLVVTKGAQNQAMIDQIRPGWSNLKSLAWLIVV